MVKVGILLLTTSINRDFKTIYDTYLIKVFFKSFMLTYSKNIDYIIYIGYDHDDKLYKQPKNRFNKIDTLNAEIKFVELHHQKGWLTKMWNELANIAYNDNCDYFYQCGDDVQFLTKDWVNMSIEELKKNNDIGVSGPIDAGRIYRGGDICKPGGERFIMTQAMVSKKHIEMFKNFFPEEIRNWLCDDYITELYKPEYLSPVKNAMLVNMGGCERYKPVIDNDLVDLKTKYVENHKKIISSCL